MKYYVTLLLIALMSAGLSAQTLLLDNFEDGDTINIKGGQWDTFGAAGSTMSLDVTILDGYKSSNSLHVAGKWVSYGGVENYMTNSKIDTNLSKFSGISFAAKAGNNTNKSWIRIREKKAESQRGYAYFVYKFTAPADWQVFKIPWDSLTVQYGDPVPPFDATDIYAIDFAAAAANQEADFYIDDVTFYTSTGTGVQTAKTLPVEYALKQNFPNPFNPATTIQYSLKEDGFVTLRVYDIVGHNVAQLVNEFKNAGEYKVQFNAMNLPSGLYFYQLNANGHIMTNKMTLMK